MTARAPLYLLLLALGAGWGVTVPLAKIALEGGFRQIGMIFWSALLGVLVLGAVTLLRGKGLPLGRAQLWRYVAVALLGTVLPNAASFTATAHLPAGVVAILISMVPMFAFPMALALGIDGFGLGRISGLCLGLAAVALISGPDAALPAGATLAFVPVALIGPVLYAMEGNMVARWGMAGLDPIQLLFGACLVSVALTGPMALALGQMAVPDPREGSAGLSVIAMGLINSVVYAGYVWLVGRAGAVFAAQVAYTVTGGGVLWSMALLGEVYSPWVWAALGLMLAGLFLVQPRGNGALVRPAPVAHDAP